MPVVQPSNTKAKISLFLFCLFAFFRPLSLMGGSIYIGSLNCIQFFAVASSYLFLIIIFLNIRSIKIDLVNILIFLFSCSVALTWFWGGEIGRIARTILPFLVFYAVRCCFFDIHAIYKILVCLLLGYSIPVILSFINFISGHVVGLLVYGVGVIKYQGVFLKSHTFGHSMTLVSFLYGFYIALQSVFRWKKRWWGYFILGVLSISLCNLYFSYVRTAYVGALIFWLIFLFSYNRKVFWIAMLCAFFILFFNRESLLQIFLMHGYHGGRVNVDAASSGRLTIWSHNLGLWLHLPIEYKLAGIGFGAELKKLYYINGMFWPSHNDWLSVFVQGGIFSLCLIVSIYVSLVLKTANLSFHSSLEKVFKATIFAVITMNFLSNSYIHRPELAQIFWLLMGIMYTLGFCHEKRQL